MARMIPEHGPHHTESYGERHLYSVLKSQLPDEYTVIHSLPWLNSAVTNLDHDARPTGEIDFLIVHPENGVLALEVKSGVYHVENSFFFHVRNGYKIDPLGQTKRNVHGFASWLGAEPSLRLRIGYGFIFPDTDLDRSNIPGMYDSKSNPPQPLYIDFEAYADVAQKIITLMQYWKGALRNSDLGHARAQMLIDYLTPKIDGSPRWASRIRYDDKVWLQLTSEQSTVVRTVMRNHNSLVTGWPGTGKTLIAIEAARKLSVSGKRVLVISFNARLTEHIRAQLEGYGNCTVSTWHGLCRQAANALNHPSEGDEWFKVNCVEDLSAAIDSALIGKFDALIVDESQALAESWCRVLVNWFEEKPKAFFCDETQVFKFERGVTLEGLKDILQVDAFPLSIVLRMPKAVTDILLEVVPPKLQLSSPRVSEPDTALEIITLTPCEELLRIKKDLISNGVHESNIVVLTGSIIDKQYFYFLKGEGLVTENIAKFRGLESPVVIVLGAEALDTAELFSAYSRATTKFVAIYNAHNRQWKGRLDFQSRLQGNPESAAVLNKAQVPLRIRNMVSGCTSITSLGMKSLDVMWAGDWNAILVEFKSHESQLVLWVNYLSRLISHPIFIWYGDTLTKFYMLVPERHGDVEACGHYPLTMDECKKCGSLTPHSDVAKIRCALCYTVENRLLPPDQGAIEKIALYDKVITSQLPAGQTLELRPQLPLEVAAVAAHMRANKNKMRSKILQVQLPSGRNLYTAAFVFAQSRIAVCQPGNVMSVDVLADEIYQRYTQLEQVSPAEWRSILASAFATFKQKGYVVKIGKKLYRPVEDADAPVPKGYNRD
ncbi:nuclease-related domain-containing DEAD/DEAH box helicase [Pseudomonas tussilaginis]|uniref:nuclease-related domain-containing DEAD/DEAH box helicase n=1 Tax=Pseudomonas putida TaxID=303 RepID=UPI00236418C3|nr:NERD domain-containing protein [Pseudomonas putida]MDD1976205.1 NERD domain-containing protein [Pseudomonas putida]